jgi:hypothetical protein
MAEILEAVGKQPGRGFDRLFLENDMFWCGDGEADEFHGIGHGVLLVVPGATTENTPTPKLFGSACFTKP